mmetsp:Transcript_72211/g.135023  ORF Transcript_72211/g.135023 Transcript_72211/m.135023 type:complete len:723 (-) Transcript_72211:68-2236(-)
MAAIQGPAHAIPPPAAMPDRGKLVAESMKSIQQEVKVLMGQNWQVLPFGGCATGLSKNAPLDVMVFPHDKVESDLLDKNSKSFGKVMADKGYSVTATERNGVLKMVHKEKELEVKIFMRNHSDTFELRSFQLQKAYREIHPILQTLVHHIKMWTVGELPADTLKYFPSYTITLMVIFFLQVHHYFPILDPNFFQGRDGAEIIELDKWEPPENQPLPILILQYLHFFGEVYNWQHEVVSVRLGRRALRLEGVYDYYGKIIWTFEKLPEVELHSQWQRLVIEDPIERSGLHRNLTLELTERAENELRWRCIESRNLLQQGRVPASLANSEISDKNTGGLLNLPHPPALAELARPPGPPGMPAPIAPVMSPMWPPGPPPQRGLELMEAAEEGEQEGRAKGPRNKGKPDVNDQQVLQLEKDIERGQAGAVWSLARKDSASSSAVQTLLTNIMNRWRNKEIADEEADRKLRAIVSDLHGHVHTATEHPCANFVLQHIVEKAPARHAAFIIRELRGREVWASKHRFGCRVIVRFVKRCSDAPNDWDPTGNGRDTPTVFIRDVLESVDQLLTDKYGNYVIQEVLQHSTIAEHKHLVAEAVLRNPVHIARDQHGCRVVEGTLTPGQCSDADRREIAFVLLEPEGYRKQLLESRYGCFVLRLLLRLPDFQERAKQLLRELTPQMDKSWYGRRLRPFFGDDLEAADAPGEELLDDADEDEDPTLREKGSVDL